MVNRKEPEKDGNPDPSPRHTVGWLAREGLTVAEHSVVGLRILLVVSIVGLWFVVTPTSTLACKCGAAGTPEEKLAESALVFRGTVTSIESHRQEGWLTVSFEVATVWKGPDSETFTLYTPEDSAACGYPFEEAVEYVVYSWDGVDVGRCGRTAPVELAGEDLAAFATGGPSDSEIGLPNTGNGGLVEAESPQDRTAAILVVVVIGLLLFGVAGARLYVRRHDRIRNATRVERT